MNERIQELAVHAKLIVPEYNGFDPTKLSVSHKIFAALIIKECADFIDKAISDGGVDGRILKEHFGV